MKKTVTHFILGAFTISLLGGAAIEVSAATHATLLDARLTYRIERIQARLALIQAKAETAVKSELAAHRKSKADKIAAQEQALTPNENSSTQGATEAEAEVTTSASQRGREIGETNRAYGQQLRDPNLSQEERQTIIQEKKEYNRSQR